MKISIRTATALDSGQAREHIVEILNEQGTVLAVGRTWRNHSDIHLRHAAESALDKLEQICKQARAELVRAGLITDTKKED